ncbi:hypothetical protein CVT24_001311 [Panaeolus cyanescens]|uniref:Uncharacterized protein n=1 Tax=Panaeolus cyanescens TaxID=181874 RepID=A0A409YYY2_9AGAR|nr:hypothetical protein CVT24_001311 [Panaeolus cyanescens]
MKFSVVLAVSIFAACAQALNVKPLYARSSGLQVDVDSLTTRELVEALEDRLTRREKGTAHLMLAAGLQNLAAHAQHKGNTRSSAHGGGGAMPAGGDAMGGGGAMAMDGSAPM